ncbi:MAG: hypothetical protein Q9204_004164 [Flavoplaca sp. TL-2023a]
MASGHHQEQVTRLLNRQSDLGTTPTAPETANSSPKIQGDMSSSAPLPPNGDENRQGGTIITTYLVTVLASVVVALRMATRIWIVRNVGWDDYTILFATIGIIIGCALVLV